MMQREASARRVKVDVALSVSRLVTQLARLARWLVPATAMFSGGCYGPVVNCDLQAGEGVPPANAGCLVLRGESVLLVRSLKGQWSLPGGRSENHESPMCTAQRETLEETGLEVIPTQLIQVFDNGFQLYRCEMHDPAQVVKPRAPTEIRQAGFLRAQEFDSLEWRYPARAIMLREWLVPDLPPDNFDKKSPQQ